MALCQFCFEFVHTKFFEVREGNLVPGVGFSLSLWECQLLLSWKVTEKNGLAWRWFEFESENGYGRAVNHQAAPRDKLLWR